MGTNQYARVLDRRLISKLLRVCKQSMLVGAVVACLLPQSLLAAVTSNVTGGVLTVTSDAGDPITVTCDTLQVKINGANPGSGAAACNTITQMNVIGGPDTNTIDLNTVATTDFTTLVTVTVDGAGSNDVITGTFLADTLNGGDGNDTLVGHRGNDTMNGDAGDDTLVWNNGDGSDTANGGAGNDTMVVNGGGVSETFTISATGTGVRFDRLNPGPFFVNIDPTTENLELNSNGGADIVTGTVGLNNVITMTLNGGDGNDQITGGDGNDTLNGDGDNDLLVGFRGADAMNGGTGDDTLVWNNGDGSDSANGGDGNDTMVVNGAGVSETFTISATGTGVRFDRLNPGPFFVDINPTTENLELNANAGADIVTGTVGLNNVITMTLNGGADNDHITGGDGRDTLNGDDGDDTLVGFRGNDTMNGGAGNDTLIWNNGDGSDSANGDDGNDTMVVNGAGVSETFTISATGTGVRFDRVNPAPFFVDINPTTENLELNANAGADIVTGTVGLNNVITMTVNGGNGSDHITGGDGKDTLNGDDGDDTLVGFRGNDTMNGGAGNDTLIWNNGDGSDIMDGGNGDDTVVVNGGAISETFAISPTSTLAAAGLNEPLVGSVFFQRVTPAPFTLDIEAESVEVNGNDGDDTFNVTPLDQTDVHFDGGSQPLADILRVDAQNRTVQQTGNQIIVAGKQPVTYVGVEVVEILNADTTRTHYLPRILLRDQP
jgi:Ca2+-binding RTX toxin-like protein